MYLKLKCRTCNGTGEVWPGAGPKIQCKDCDGGLVGTYVRQTWPERLLVVAGAIVDPDVVEFKSNGEIVCKDGNTFDDIEQDDSIFVIELTRARGALS